MWRDDRIIFNIFMCVKHIFIQYSSPQLLVFFLQSIKLVLESGLDSRLANTITSHQ